MCKHPRCCFFYFNFLILVMLLDTILNLLSLFKITRSDFLICYLMSKLLNSKFQFLAVMLNLIQHRILLFPGSNFQKLTSKFYILGSQHLSISISISTSNSISTCTHASFLLHCPRVHSSPLRSSDAKKSRLTKFPLNLSFDT